MKISFFFKNINSVQYTSTDFIYLSSFFHYKQRCDEASQQRMISYIYPLVKNMILTSCLIKMVGMKKAEKK